MMLYPLQLSSVLEVIPRWLPPTAITFGFMLLAIGMGQRYYEGLFGHWDAYSTSFSFFSVICLTFSISGAMFVTIQRQNLTLLFVFFIFMSGRIIQGAVTTRFLQKILDFFLFNSSDSGAGSIRRVYRYIKSKLKDLIVLSVVAGIISLHTTLSIISVFIIGTGDVVEAIERFWIGYFFLIAAGLIYDSRYFAHRTSWIAASGLVIAVTGAFLYEPVGFSTFTVALAPYLDNPIPDWMRWPLGAIGFLFGVVFWTVFYIKTR